MSSKSFEIFSDRVFIHGELQPATISIKDDFIDNIALGHRWNAATDYTGQVIMPGAIDAHVHINEPGRTSWEGFETATKAAVRGGITSLVDMPLNSSPVVINLPAFENKIAASAGKLFSNCGFWAGATRASINEVTSLIKAGCLGVKVFLSDSGINEFPNISLDDLDVLMSGIQHLDVPVLAHCELDTLPAEHDLHSYPQNYDAYLRSRPKSWENEAIKKFVALAAKHSCKVHVVHLASDEVIEWIDEQKKDGVPFTVETCPHYFFFNAEEIEDGNTLLKCAPPIRGKINGANLRRGLKAGIIDFVSSDHSPAPPSIKEITSGDFEKAWGGIAGLQFLLSASWTALKEEMELEEFIPLLTSKPAQFLGIHNEVGSLEVGYRADITVWSPQTTFEVSEKAIEHRHKETPYNHRNLFGLVHSTIVNGKYAFQKGKIAMTPYGKIIKGNHQN